MDDVIYKPTYSQLTTHLTASVAWYCTAMADTTDMGLLFMVLNIALLIAL